MRLLFITTGHLFHFCLFSIKEKYTRQTQNRFIPLQGEYTYINTYYHEIEDENKFKRRYCFINENFRHTMPSYNETKLSTSYTRLFESWTNQHMFFVTFFFEQNKSHIMNNICSVEHVFYENFLNSVKEDKFKFSASKIK